MREEKCTVIGNNFIGPADEEEIVSFIPKIKWQQLLLVLLVSYVYQKKQSKRMILGQIDVRIEQRVIPLVDRLAMDRGLLREYRSFTSAAAVSRSLQDIVGLLFHFIHIAGRLAFSVPHIPIETILSPFLSSVVASVVLADVCGNR